MSARSKIHKHGVGRWVCDRVPPTAPGGDLRGILAFSPGITRLVSSVTDMTTQNPETEPQADQAEQIQQTERVETNEVKTSETVEQPASNE